MNALNDLLSASPEQEAIEYRHFPTQHQAAIFRNWELIPVARLAQILETDENTVLAAAKDMGLPVPPQVDERWLERGYITIIRNNWHLMPVEQLLELLGWSDDQLAYALKEDDFLWIKLGRLKPKVARVKYRPLAYKEKDRTQRLREYIRRYFPEQSTWQPFSFVDEFNQTLTWQTHSAISPDPDEFALDSTWYLEYPSTSFLQKVISRFRAHLSGSFNLALDGAKQKILLRVVPDEQKLSESHQIDITSEQIIIQAVDEVGLMRGLYWLENAFEDRGGAILKPQRIVRDTKFDVRLLYPYAAVYGDPFTDPANDPLPEGLLERLSRVGINGIWLQAVLYLMTPFPFDPSLSTGWEKRIEGLNRLIEKAKRYGIGVYLYLNEPRAMPRSFFDQRPQLAGSSDGTYTCLCTSKKDVQDYLRNACKQIFTQAPDLAGVLTITMSENMTNCWSRGTNHCPVCSQRKPYEVIGEVNRCIEEGVHAAAPSAKVICWSWAWKQVNGWPNDVVPEAVDHLPHKARLMCTSESEKPYRIGGIDGIVADYSISIPGPGDRARLFWNQALRRNMTAMAKVQLNNSWECSAVPYLPVIDLIQEHLDNLFQCGVSALMVSWTLGGYPSANLALASQYYWSDDSQDSAQNPENEPIKAAQAHFSDAFREFPFHVGVLYRGPQNFGPSNPLLPKKSNYAATMIGFPYDDLESWRSIYPYDVFTNQLMKLCVKWEQGLEVLETAPQNPRIRELANVSRTAYCHFKSSLLQSKYVKLRDELPVETELEAYNAQIQKGLIQDIIRQERELALCLWRILNEDPRIGFEASNHYLYTEKSLKEKVLNCQYLLDQVFVPIVRQSDIELSIRQLGIQSGDIVLVHSSLSSLGKVEHGADSVIKAFESVIGDEGTLVFPTLCQEDFTRSYETWHLDKPSDVGYLTEVFRKLPGSFRSDQATHSVAARGRKAQALTSEHTAYGPRYGIFGDYAFSRSSPWQKMYDSNAKVVFIGVSMRKNTFKHFMEYIVVDEALSKIADRDERENLKNRVWDFKHFDSRENRMWPFHNAEQLQQKLDESGYVRKSRCNEATLMCINVRDMVDLGLKWFAEEPETWYQPDALSWLRDAQRAMSGDTVDNADEQGES